MKWTLILGLAVLVVLLNEHGSSAAGLDSLLSDEDLQILKKGKLFIVRIGRNTSQCLYTKEITQRVIFNKTQLLKKFSTWSQIGSHIYA